jgi:peptidoglycan/LPS O-acetylase OafA/YrhL
MFGFHKLGGWPVEHWLKILWMTYEGILWGAFLLTYIYFADWLPKIFTTPISLAGQMSYSVYLTHYIFIVSVINQGWLLFTELPFAYSALLTTTFVVLPLVLSVSWLTYRYIEKPFINMRGVYLKD